MYRFVNLWLLTSAWKHLNFNVWKILTEKKKNWQLLIKKISRLDEELIVLFVVCNCWHKIMMVNIGTQIVILNFKETKLCSLSQ